MVTKTLADSVLSVRGNLAFLNLLIKFVKTTLFSNNKDAYSLKIKKKKVGCAGLCGDEMRLHEIRVT